MEKRKSCKNCRHNTSNKEESTCCSQCIIYSKFTPIFTERVVLPLTAQYKHA